MGRFNKNWFCQIMIDKFLRKKLNELKSIVAMENKVNHKLSHREVIYFLVNHYEKTKRIEYPKKALRKLILF